ncbi:unnamed protein product [Cyprideis torosa]|uniref:Uncharacterized protein n=1 Tax=Cyprideis torosa TaxID=163714 RepID=A0A7R8W778_9CRUS|nr:unnamed protein product [Cyprideis torosa]CAG0887287.1 unnamed protein product [Cyprideis torosa]
MMLRVFLPLLFALVTGDHGDQHRRTLSAPSPFFGVPSADLESQESRQVFQPPVFAETRQNVPTYLQRPLTEPAPKFGSDPSRNFNSVPVAPAVPGNLRASPVTSGRSKPAFSPAASPRRTEPEEEVEEVTTPPKPYSFQYKVDDRIEDLTQARYEVRSDDGKVEGVYSYSDGNNQRTVHYVADEGGFRIVKEDVKPLSGLNRDLVHGQAYVAQQYDGGLSEYQVRAEEIFPSKDSQASTFDLRSSNTT